MEVYVLDPILRREYIIDRFISLIWTERFNVFGDFQLDIYSTYQSRSLLKPDTLLAMSESFYVMRIESVEDDVDGQGNKILIIKGRSMEAILLDRVAFLSLSDTTSVPKWTITDVPAAVARKVFHDICVTGTLNADDVIPFIVEGTFLAVGTIPEPTTSITVDITPTTVYDVTTQICSAWDLGFRILRQDGSSGSSLYYDIYAGSDRTTGQSVLPAVVFSPELDNLQNTKELTAIDKAKNVAYVFSPAGYQTVYASGVDPTVAGFQRRILMVDATDITSTVGLTAALAQRGNEALAAARATMLFDGEINQNSQYVYGRDYNLGDMVESRNDDGVANVMQVTEQIFVSDSTGDRSYPTLTLRTYITTGAWLSWMNNKQWVDLDPDTTDVWANQP
jgi:hypothetical protein